MIPVDPYSSKSTVTHQSQQVEQCRLKNKHTHTERKKTKFEYTNTLDRAKMKIKFLVIECANYIRK